MNLNLLLSKKKSATRRSAYLPAYMARAKKKAAVKTPTRTSWEDLPEEKISEEELNELRKIEEEMHAGKYIKFSDLRKR